MKNRIYLAMNYRPTEEYWLCSEFKRRHVSYDLDGINNNLRKLRYVRFGGIIWKLIRFVRAIIIALKAKRDQIIVVQDDTASSIFIACILFILFKKNKVICLNMMDSLHSNLIKRILYKYAFRRMYASTNNKSVTDLYCSLYKLPQENFFFLPDCIANWGMKILKDSVKSEDRGYIFSGGSTFRDWDLFIEVAKRLPQYKFIGVARKSGFPQKEMSENIEMYFDVNEKIFNDFLKNSRLVFMPIKVKTQGGQIVIFKAGLYHKPVVTTNTAAIQTYIENGRNGLLTKFKDVQDAVRAIEYIMSDTEIRNKFSEQLYHDIIQFTPSYFTDLLLDFLKTKNIYL